jgi:ATP-dependent DNA helicase DinG
VPEVPAVSRSHSLTARVARAFDADGAIAAAVDEFEPREGQRQLAAAVAGVFSDGGTLVAEAGTGTGKTLAYLVPAVLSGTRVLISTGTRTLQDQIFYKDIPALAKAMGVEIRAAYMKGRTNYLCRHRYGRVLEAEAAYSPDERRTLATIAEWVAETPTGDRAEIEDLPDDLPLWQELSATSEQCLGRECPQYVECFITQMRERAAAAQVIVVNHHLLCADASVRRGDFGAVIPACDLAVIDEAHQIEDVVTQYFGVMLSTHRVDEFVRDAEQAVSSLPAEATAAAVALAHAATDVQQSARYLFESARTELRGDFEGTLTAPSRAGTGRPSSDRIMMTPAVAERLADPSARLRDAIDQFGRLISTRIDPEHRDDLASIAARATGMRDDLKVLIAADDPRYVHFLEARGRGMMLRAAPIDVSSIIKNHVVAGRKATVLTSATLTVDASFEYVLGRCGVPEATTLRVPAEFDYRRQAILYLPPDMPDPRSRDFNRAAAGVIAELLDRTHGRAFVLFTSYAAMREVHAIISPHVTWPLLVQGTAPRSALLRAFRATPNAVLLATSSFWQGVDVAGEALSCVVVDRLPFASPSDPLVAARIAAIESRGGQAFAEYQVPLATLTLLQGLGRLIRTRQDRGVLAVLDPRLRRMSYGRRFLASLPPAPVTDDLDDVTRFFSG